MRAVDSNAAAHLARNPLGIVALFLLLVYGVAGLVLGTSSSSLSTTERAPLVWFLVIFPVVVLGVFAWLLARHHTKFYAPRDFLDSEGFFRAMTPLERRERLEADVVAAKREIEISAIEAHVEHPPAQALALPIRSNVILAEELAIREIEAEFGRPVLRGVRTTDGQFDGVFRLPDREVAVEVKYTRRPDWLTISSHARVIAESLRGRGRAIPVTVLLAVVCDGLDAPNKARGRHVLERRLSDAGPTIKVRIYDFRELLLKHGLAVEALAPDPGAEPGGCAAG